MSDTKTCGLSDDYSCEVGVTCLIKKQCDGQHYCNITVDYNLVLVHLCPGLTKYLYFEYQCIREVETFTIIITCDSEEKNLAKCSITGSDGSCSKISYVKCNLENVKTARMKLV